MKSFFLNKKNTPDVLFIIILVIQISLIIFGCAGKTLTGDEYFSYSTANNDQGFLYYTRGYIDLISETGWIKGDGIRELLTVENGDQFDLLSTYRQARSNVHPPLFYMLLHLTSGIIPGQLSHWTGSFWNVLFAVAILVLLYKLSQLLFKDKYVALIAPFIWGFSSAASVLTTYVRMYTMLCLMCLLILYFHVYLFDEKKWSTKNLLLLAACVTIGGLTHHFFYVFLGFSCITYFIILLIRKSKLRKLITYCVTIGSGIFAELCVYPYFIKQIFFGYRGTEAQENFASSDMAEYFRKVTSGLRTINKRALNGYFTLLLIFILILFVIACILYFYRKNNKNKIHAESCLTDNAKTAFIYIAISGLLYILVLTKVAYAPLWTYISPAYIPTLLSCIAAIVLLCNYINPKYIFVIFIPILLLTTIRHIPERISSTHANYIRFQEIDKTLRSHEGSDVIFCYEEWDNIFYGRMADMIYMDEIYSIDCSTLQDNTLPSILELREDKDALLLYLPYDSEHKEEYLRMVETQLQMQTEILYEYGHVSAYVLIP